MDSEDRRKSIPQRTGRVRSGQGWATGTSMRTLVCVLSVDGASIDLRQMTSQCLVRRYCTRPTHTGSSEALGAAWVGAFVFPFAVG